MNTETEYELRPIAGYEGKYSVSNTGEVFSHNYLRTGKTAALKQKRRRDGYLVVTLCHNGKSKMKQVHRLVLEAFKPNPDNKQFCDHIDTVRTNNHIENLRWTTRKENNSNPTTRTKNSEARKGSKNPSYKTSIHTFKNINTSEVFVGTRYDFRVKYNLNPGRVSDLINNKQSHHKNWVLV